jgi:putative intracellular protease/amidase
MSPTKPRVLFVFTSHGTLISGAPTGYFLPEPARPYYVLAPHADIDFASPKGGTPPLDPPSFKTFYEDQKDESSIKFFHDEVVQNKLKNSIKLSEVDASKYDAVFFPGG